MFVPLTIAMLLGTPGDGKELFAAEEFYKGQDGKEQVFEGVLKYKPRGDGVVGFGRYNPFTLTMTTDGKKSIREVYVGGKDELLKPYADKAVRIVGKPVDMEVEGTMHREIWPARVELAPEKK